MKKFFTSLMLSAFIGLSAIAQIPTNGLVAYFPFNGNANDESGNGNNGIVHGAILTTDRFGHSNSAYQFVGNDNNTISYIVANHNNLPSGHSPRTISVWATNDTYGVLGGNGNDGHPLIAYGTPATNSSNELMFFTTNSSIAKVRYGGFNNDLDIPFSYTLSTWYNIVATFDGTTAKIFINNSLLGSGNYSSWNTVLDSVVIGAQTPRTRFYNGKIDDIRIYNRVLNQSEISTLYNENITKCSMTVTDTLVINANITGYNPLTFANTLKIYPNPTFDKITIDCGSNYNTLNGYTIKITNSLGQTVYESLVNKQTVTIDLKSWTGKGIYFVHLIDASSNTIEIKKIVLQ